MELMSWAFQFLWDNFFSFMSFELDFGDVSFTLWEFLFGSLVVFGIVVFIIKRCLE